MRAVKSSIVSILAIGLFVVSSSGVTAQGDEASSFTLTFELPPIESGINAETGLQRRVFATTATDERATGVMTMITSQNGVWSSDTYYDISKEGVRLANDEGSWVGNYVSASFFGTEPGEEEVQGGGLWQLEGQDGYEGLTMLMVANPEKDLLGIIVSSEVVPEQPEPPLE